MQDVFNIKKTARLCSRKDVKIDLLHRTDCAKDIDSRTVTTKKQCWNIFEQFPPRSVNQKATGTLIHLLFDDNGWWRVGYEKHNEAPASASEPAEQQSKTISSNSFHQGALTKKPLGHWFTLAQWVVAGWLWKAQWSTSIFGAGWAAD